MDIVLAPPLPSDDDSSSLSQTMALDPTITPIVPKNEADWEAWREVFTRLYIDEGLTLPQVMTIMEEDHHFKASEKMYKNRIKTWKLFKYFKEDEARQIVDGEIPVTGAAHLPALIGEPEEVVERAARALKRKRARERSQTQPSSSSTNASGIQPFQPQTSDAIVQWKPPQSTIPAPQGFRLNGVAEQFLFNLRSWTHDAFVYGHLDTKPTTQHHSGRHASRLLSSDLTAGTNLFEKGKPELAFTYWNRAIGNFTNPDLFKNWYQETPIRLLFEASRVAHNGYGPLAAMLLKSIKSWARTYLAENDSRHALFSVFGDLEVGQLRDLYVRAAHCLYNGLDSRLDKDNPLLYEVRLNRALDMVWYDPDSDLREWLPPVEEVDQACGPNNPFSVYFLLVQAYRHIAQESFAEADRDCVDARNRLAVMKEGDIDLFRVGLAYRRLGRQQYNKQRFRDARRSFNTALKYTGSGNRLSASILVEIYQYQESMATALNDKEDAELWSRKLHQLEQQTKAQEAEDNMPMSQEFRLTPADEVEDAGSTRKKRRVSPSPNRSMTM